MYVDLKKRQAIWWAELTRVHQGASACSMVCVEEQAVWQAEQSLLHTRLSELAWGCWLCNKAFNGHTASPRLPGATTKSLFTVTCPDVTDLFISLRRLVHPSPGSSMHKKKVVLSHLLCFTYICGLKRTCIVSRCSCCVSRARIKFLPQKVQKRRRINSFSLWHQQY